MNDLQAQAQRLQSRNAGVAAAYKKKPNNIVQQAINTLASPVRNYQPFGLRDAQTGLKAMFTRR